MVPLVVFLGEADYSQTSLVMGSNHHNHMTFDYLKAERHPIRALAAQDNLVARLNLPNMKYPAVFDGIPRSSGTGLQAKYLRFIKIYAGLTDNELQQSSNIWRTNPTSPEYLRQEGRQEGERTVLERNCRHSVSYPEITEKAKRSFVNRLENWAEKVLDAKTLEDVFDSSH